MLRKLLFLLLATTAAFAQTAPTDNDELRAVVILARHGVRAPIESETRFSAFNALAWPAWPVEPGVLTPHGVEALKRMGEFYRQRYASLLTAGCKSVYAESTNTSRTIASAKATLSAVAPDAPSTSTPTCSRTPLVSTAPASPTPSTAAQPTSPRGSSTLSPLRSPRCTPSSPPAPRATQPAIHRHLTSAPPCSRPSPHQP